MGNIFGEHYLFWVINVVFLEKSFFLWVINLGDQIKLLKIYYIMKERGGLA